MSRYLIDSIYEYLFILTQKDNTMGLSVDKCKRNNIPFVYNEWFTVFLYDRTVKYRVGMSTCNIK